jgi:hypothetical protein
MSSILKVDTIQDQSGNNIINENADTITIGASGDTISIPSGATIDTSGATLTLPTTIEVDTIEPQSGTSLTLGASGDTITIPSGATITNSGTATGFGVNTPAFLARNDGSTAQSIANTTWTELTNFNTELFDSDSAYNTTTCRFTPQVAGKYVFFANVYYTTLPSGGLFLGISKNGNITGNANTDFLFASANIYGPVGACILDLNGTTDYVSVFTLHSFGSARNVGGAGSGSYMNFHGYRLIGA